MNRFFVPGTNTEVGKTRVSTALLRAAKRRGQNAVGYKPIESGVPEHQPAATSLFDAQTDASALAMAAGHEPLCTYSFTPPIAPSVAASLIGQSIETATIQKEAERITSSADFSIVEGAGGLLVPINSNETIADLISALKLPTLIVAADILGSMNHTLLTLEACKHRGIEISGIILNQLSPESANTLSNRDEIQRFSDAPVLPMKWVCNEEELCQQGEFLLSSLGALSKPHSEFGG